MSTIIKLRCIDQVLALESTPVVASGGLGEDFIQVSFCSKWDGLAKTAVFWRTEDDAYHVPLDQDGVCPIPPEVLADEGAIYFGLFGVSEDGRQRTSEVMRYTITKGAITSGTKPSEPTADIYTQLLAKYAEVLNGVQEVVDAAEASRQAAEQAAAAAEETAATAEQTAAQSAATEREIAASAAQSATAAAAAQSAAEQAATKAAQEVMNTHVSNKSNPHGVTAAQVGAVATDGSNTMTGNLDITKSLPQVNLTNTSTSRTARFTADGTATNSAVFMNVTDDSNSSALFLYPETTTLDNAARLRHRVSGANTWYNILHSGNFHDYGGSNPNLLDNWYFADPIDQRDGYVVEPESINPNIRVYKDAEFTDPAEGYPVSGWRQVTRFGTNSKGEKYFVYHSGIDYYGHAEYATPGYASMQNSGQYGMDRWRVYNGRLNVENGCVAFTTYSATTPLLAQRLEKAPVAGQYTMSVMLDDNSVHSGSATFGGSLSVGESLVFGTFTINGVKWSLRLTRNDTNYYFNLLCVTSGENIIRLKAMKVELGSVQTLAYQDAGGNWVLNDPPPNTGMELLKGVQAFADSTDTYANKVALHTGNLGAHLADFDIGQIVIGSYVGTGTYGEANPTSLTFDKPPKWLSLCDEGGIMINRTAQKFTGVTSALTTSFKHAWCDVTDSSGWVGSYTKCSEDRKTISWYVSGVAAESAAAAQANASGYTYYYIAIC